MGLQQASPIGAGSKVGLEVMPIDSMTLSDAYDAGERAPNRLIVPEGAAVVP
jgi:hypothetical protein